MDQEGDQWRCLMPLKLNFIVVQFTKLTFYGDVNATSNIFNKSKKRRIKTQ